MTDSVAAVGRRTQEIWRELERSVPDRDHAPSRYSAALLPFIDYVDRCSSPADRLMVTGLYPEVYVIADRGFAGGQIAFLSGFYTDEAEQARTIGRLKRQSVPFVLLIEDVRLAMPRLMAYVDTRYQPLAHVEVPGTPGVQVLVERGRPHGGIDPSTGWPCFGER